MRARPWVGIALACVLVLSPVASGWWQPAFADPSDLTLGDVVWGRITQPAGGYTAAQRIVYVRKRITNILSDTRFKAARNLFVNATAMGASAVISVGALSGGPTYVVVTVTPRDAAANHATAHQLASRWATSLARGLSTAMPTSYVKVK